MHVALGGVQGHLGEVAQGLGREPTFHKWNVGWLGV
jgi:hypothetical protein